MGVLKISGLVLMILFLGGRASYAQIAEEYLERGIEYGAQGKFGEAEKEFREALKIDRFCLPAKQCLELIGDLLEERVEKEVGVHLFKGIAYVNKGMFDELYAEWGKAIAINPNNIVTEEFVRTMPAVMENNLKMLANDLLAHSTVGTISVAIETYVAVNNGEYPNSESALVDYLPRHFGNGNEVISGYRYLLDLYYNSYKIVAKPENCGTTGKKVFTVQNGGVIQEEGCK